MDKLRYEEVETIARGGRWYLCSYGQVQFQVKVNSNMTAGVRPAATRLQSCCVTAGAYEFCSLHPRDRIILFTLAPSDASPFTAWFLQAGLEEAPALVAGNDLLNELLAVDWIQNASR